MYEDTTIDRASKEEELREKGSLKR